MRTTAGVLLAFMSFFLPAAAAYAFIDGTDSSETGRTVVHVYVSYPEEPDVLQLEDTICLEGLYPSEYVVIAVSGLILDFQHIAMEWDDETGGPADSYIISSIDSIADRTVVIHSFMSCGIPSERIRWTSTAGTEYGRAFQSCGIGPNEWKYVLDR